MVYSSRLLLGITDKEKRSMARTRVVGCALCAASGANDDRGSQFRRRLRIFSGVEETSIRLVGVPLGSDVLSGALLFATAIQQNNARTLTV